MRRFRRAVAAGDTDDDGQEDDEDAERFKKLRADAVFVGPDDDVDSQERRVVAVCAGLLAGDLTRVQETAKAEPSLGWSSTENVQPLVLPVLFAWLAGWPRQPLTLDAGRDVRERARPV